MLYVYVFMCMFVYVCLFETFILNKEFIILEGLIFEIETSPSLGGGSKFFARKVRYN